MVERSSTNAFFVFVMKRNVTMYQGVHYNRFEMLVIHLVYHTKPFFADLSTAQYFRDLANNINK